VSAHRGGAVFFFFGGGGILGGGAKGGRGPGGGLAAARGNKWVPGPTVWAPGGEKRGFTVGAPLPVFLCCKNPGWGGWAGGGGGTFFRAFFRLGPAPKWFFSLNLNFGPEKKKKTKKKQQNQNCFKKTNRGPNCGRQGGAIKVLGGAIKKVWGGGKFPPGGPVRGLGIGSEKKTPEKFANGIPFGRDQPRFVGGTNGGDKKRGGLWAGISEGVKFPGVLLCCRVRLKKKGGGGKGACGAGPPNPPAGFLGNGAGTKFPFPGGRPEGGGLASWGGGKKNPRGGGTT